jgi:autotransporter-associated beta strand protein
LLANPAALQNSILNLQAGDAGTLSFGTLTSAAIGGLMGSRPLALQNASDEAVTLTVGNNAQSLAYSGALTGSGGLVKANANTLTLSGVSTFTGPTRVAGGTVILGNSVALQSSTLTLDGGALSFNYFTGATLGGLAGSGNLALTNASGAGVTLTVGGNGQDVSYAGALSGPGQLIKIGAGCQVLSRSNSYTGNTTINGGTLKLSCDPIVKFTFDSVSGGADGSVVTNDGTGGSALNGVVVNGGTGVSFVPGRVGNALNLAGDGSYVSIPSRVTSLDGNTPGADWTLAMWIKTTQAGAGYAYQGNGGWAANNTTFYLNQGNTSAGTRAGAVRWGGGWLTGNAGINNGNWRFIAITAVNGIKSIYVDGNLDAISTSWNNVSVGDLFWIGGSANTGDGVARMIGQLDEVSIYSRALTLAEVRWLTNTTTELVGNYGGQLPSTTALAVSSGATFDLGGISQTVASLGNGSGGGTVTNSGAAAATLTLGGASGTRTFTGVIADGPSSGAISLLKNGTAAAVLSGANNFRGSTTVSAGSLLVNERLGTGTVTVNGGTFGGNGRLQGPVTIQAGGTLAPGDAGVGVFTISNSLTLAGTTLIELDKTGVATNDLVRGLSTVTYGGTLAVSCLGGSLVLGDSFRIFDAASYSGTFSSLILPALDTGLEWDISGLTNGVLSIGPAPPQIASFTPVVNGDFQISGVGIAGQTYTLEGTTNLTPPIIWDFVTNAIADSNGNFLLIDASATNFPDRYYRVRFP